MTKDADHSAPVSSRADTGIQCGPRRLELRRPVVMGVLNVTPDSFSDGGRFHSPDRAVEQALRMHEEGAAILDIGGESTRPGAEEVSADQELERVIPVIESIRGRIDAVISIDTSKPKVMREAVAAGANLVNDVFALRADGALQAAAELDAAVCLMHMQGTPRTMQVNPSYDDVVSEVSEFLAGRARACVDAGIPRDRLIVDPGFGFGKTLEHNLTLLRGLDGLGDLGLPVLAGLSRKSFIGKITGSDVDDRIPGSIAFALAAMREGAAIIRAHDVKPTVDAVKVWAAVYG